MRIACLAGSELLQVLAERLRGGTQVWLSGRFRFQFAADFVVQGCNHFIQSAAIPAAAAGCLLRDRCRFFGVNSEIPCHPLILRGWGLPGLRWEMARDWLSVSYSKRQVAPCASWSVELPGSHHRNVILGQAFSTTCVSAHTPRCDVGRQ